MEAVGIETKTTTVGAATDIVAVGAGIAIVTEKEPENTVAMITNADVVTKIESKRAVVETVTARGTKKIIVNSEGRGRKT